ncbi:MAG: ketoacyl-ACP synthase III [Deltaproteobacteria bacterium]|nr:ketoacyl-ACP synthase III [Deltaproteobacteria bacterium]
MVRARIVGTGAYVPERVITNYDLEKMVSTSDEWIVTRTGIRERRVVFPDQATSDLAVEASRRALEAAGVGAADLDLIIVATLTPDMWVPSTACVLQAKLGAKKAWGFDLNAACSGFVYGLWVVDQFIRAGGARRVLLVGAEVLSKIVDWEDRNTCVLFADGAGAVVIVPEDGGRGLLGARMRSDGEGWRMVYMPGGGAAIPPSHESLDGRYHYLKMNGNELFKVAVRAMEEVARVVLADCGIRAEELDLFVPHQANLRIIQATAKRLNIPDEKIYVNIDRYGNTSAASVPLALDEAHRQALVRPGDLVLMDAFGGGLTWGAALVRW